MSRVIVTAQATEMTPWQSLANAIIVSAAKDYRRALRRVRRKATNKMALAEVADIENFFRSDWYKLLTDVDGEMLIQRLKEE